MAKTYGPACQAMGRGFAPGNIPQVWSGSAGAHEVAPLLFPPWITAAGGAGATYTAVAARYVIRDPDGTLWRSAPYVLTQSINAGATITVPTLRHLLPGTVAHIELYLSTGSAPLLQATIANDPTVDTATAVTGAAAAFLPGEALDTYGGALSQTWPIQCHTVGQWRNRVFLAAENRLYYSQELTAQFGPLWNGVLSSEWSDYQIGDILALCPVDWNYLAIIGAQGIGVIGGPGPDGLGRGAYTIQTLPTRAGITNRAAIVSGPAGCYFQDSQTGRLMVITPGLTVQECAGGAWDYSSSAMATAFHWEAERLIVFAGLTATIVIDYQHPTDVAPLGQVYRWTGTGVQFYAACIDSQGPLAIGAGGVIARAGATYQDTVGGAPVLYNMILETGELQPSDLQGEFSVSRLWLLLKHNANCGVSLTTYPDYATAGTGRSGTVTATTAQFMTRPPNCMRIQALRVKVEESAGAGGAFDFEGMAMEYVPRGRAKHLNAGQVI
jgi:hypothetical protein